MKTKLLATFGILTGTLLSPMLVSASYRAPASAIESSVEEQQKIADAFWTKVKAHAEARRAGHSGLDIRTEADAWFSQPFSVEFPEILQTLIALADSYSQTNWRMVFMTEYLKLDHWKAAADIRENLVRSYLAEGVTEQQAMNFSREPFVIQNPSLLMLVTKAPADQDWSSKLIGFPDYEFRSGPLFGWLSREESTRHSWIMDKYVQQVKAGLVVPAPVIAAAGTPHWAHLARALFLANPERTFGNPHFLGSELVRQALAVVGNPSFADESVRREVINLYLDSASSEMIDRMPKVLRSEAFANMPDVIVKLVRRSMRPSKWNAIQKSRLSDEEVMLREANWDSADLYGNKYGPDVLFAPKNIQLELRTQILSQPHWANHPVLREICEGFAPTVEGIAKAIENGRAKEILNRWRLANRPGIQERKFRVAKYGSSAETLAQRLQRRTETRKAKRVARPVK